MRPASLLVNNAFKLIYEERWFRIFSAEVNVIVPEMVQLSYDVSVFDDPALSSHFL